MHPSMQAEQVHSIATQAGCGICYRANVTRQRRPQMFRMPALAAGALLLLSMAWTSCSPTPQSTDSGSTAALDTARLNQVQVIGSHNSYKKPIDPELFSALRPKMGPRLDSLDYSHIPMPEQLTLGLRNLEIDVLHDPEGGRYADPYGLRLLKQMGKEATPYDAERMRQPGLKVLHVQDIDFRSHVHTFREALEELKAWSDAHPSHLPVVITMNAKDSSPDDPNFVKALPFDKAAWDAWDAEIREVLPASKLLTPDDVRGEYPTLESAVLAHNWPTLAAARGRFLFVLDESGEKLQSYFEGHPSAKGRVMFGNAPVGTPEAAFLILNNPEKQFNEIQHRVRSGYLVRTRADAETREARTGDRTRMETAFASGAQVVTTDYYHEDKRFNSGYSVAFPGGVYIRWNPLLLPAARPLPPLEQAGAGQ